MLKQNTHNVTVLVYSCQSHQFCSQIKWPLIHVSHTPHISCLYLMSLSNKGIMVKKKKNYSNKIKSLQPSCDFQISQTITQGLKTWGDPDPDSQFFNGKPFNSC